MTTLALLKLHFRVLENCDLDTRVRRLVTKNDEFEGRQTQKSLCEGFVLDGMD